MKDYKRFYNVISILSLTMIIIILLIGLSSCKRFKFFGLEVTEDPNAVTVIIDRNE